MCDRLWNDFVRCYTADAAAEPHADEICSPLYHSWQRCATKSPYHSWQCSATKNPAASVVFPRLELSDSHHDDDVATHRHPRRLP